MRRVLAVEIFAAWSPNDYVFRESRQPTVDRLELHHGRVEYVAPIAGSVRFALGIARKAGMQRWKRMETRVPKYGPFLTCLTPHGFLRQSLGQAQRLAANLALRQRLLELLLASVGNPRFVDAYPLECGHSF